MTLYTVWLSFWRMVLLPWKGLIITPYLPLDMFAGLLGEALKLTLRVSAVCLPKKYSLLGRLRTFLFTYGHSMVYSLPEWGSGKGKWQKQNWNQLVGKISLVCTKEMGKLWDRKLLRIDQSCLRENDSHIHWARIVCQTL